MSFSFYLFLIRRAYFVVFNLLSLCFLVFYSLFRSGILNCSLFNIYVNKINLNKYITVILHCFRLKRSSLQRNTKKNFLNAIVEEKERKRKIEIRINHRIKYCYFRWWQKEKPISAYVCTQWMGFLCWLNLNPYWPC